MTVCVKERTPCPDCRGEGILATGDNRMTPGGWAPCETCDGTGRHGELWHVLHGEYDQEVAISAGILCGVRGDTVAIIAYPVTEDREPTCPDCIRLLEEATP